MQLPMYFALVLIHSCLPISPDGRRIFRLKGQCRWRPSGSHQVLGVLPWSFILGPEHGGEGRGRGDSKGTNLSCFGTATAMTKREDEFGGKRQVRGEQLEFKNSHSALQKLLTYLTYPPPPANRQVLGGRDCVHSRSVLQKPQGLPVQLMKK